MKRLVLASAGLLLALCAACTVDVYFNSNDLTPTSDAAFLPADAGIADGNDDFHDADGIRDASPFDAQPDSGAVPDAEPPIDS